MSISLVRVRVTSVFVGAASAVYLVGFAASCGSGGAASSASSTSSTSSTSSGSAGGGGATTQACSEPSEKAFTLANVAHVDPFTSKGEYSSRLAVAANGTMALVAQGHPDPLPTRVGVRLSKDKGETWGPVLLPDVPQGFASSDPQVTVDADGNFSFVYVGVDLTSPSGRPIFAARMAAGAATLEAGVQIAGPGVDQDQATNPAIMALADGTTLVTYTGAYLSSLHAAVSKDAGKTWKTSVIVDGGGALYDMTSPCQGKGGSRVYLAHLSGTMVDPITVTLRRSDDGGLTWPADGAVTVTDPASGPAAFAAPSCVVDGNDVWVSYGLTDDPVDFGFLTVQRIASIQVAHSSDGGKTFEARYDAHDASAGASFLSPRMVREESGALDLSYIAGKDNGDTAATVRTSRSTDGGKSWCGSVVVHAPVTFDTALTHVTSLSRHHGLAYHDGSLFLTYPDNTTDFSHVGFARLGIP